jgi:peptide-methionine (S)-S-oxide reductase
MKLRNYLKVAVTMVTAIFFVAACAQNENQLTSSKMTDVNNFLNNNENSNINALPQDAQMIDTATFGAGCFWCVEAVFQRLEGVLTVASGYSNGFVKNPSYKEVCAGTTGHAEVCRITYDKNIVSFDELLEVFWKTHDPTTLNRQGNDVGTQYRSAVFYHSDEQKKIAEDYRTKLNAEKVYPNPIVTEIKKIENYYPAEDYHQNYFNQNSDQGYCQFVIQPKLEKFEKVFKDKMKK